MLGGGGAPIIKEGPTLSRLWGTRGSYYNMPQHIFYLLKGDYKRKDSCKGVLEYGSGTRETSKEIILVPLWGTSVC